MKTGQLIALLAVDAEAADSRVRRPFSVAWAAAVGILVPAVVFLLTLGVRPDLATAAATVRFPFKFVVTLALVAAVLPLLTRLARPDAGATVRHRALWVAPLLVTIAVAIELVVVPVESWQARLVGSNALTCLMAIPLLSLFPAAALMLVMRHGAPARPGTAGALCGLAAAGLAATVYALHCDDDSPLFVAVWYGLASAFVMAVCAAAGRRLLRW